MVSLMVSEYFVQAPSTWQQGEAFASEYPSLVEGYNSKCCNKSDILKAQEDGRYHVMSMPRISNNKWAADDTLKESLKTYADQRWSIAEILKHISRVFSQYSWSKRTLKRRLKYFNISYIYKTMDIEVLEAITEEIHGIGKNIGNCGHRQMAQILKLKHGLNVPERRVREVMRIIDPNRIAGKATKRKKRPQNGILISNITEREMVSEYLVQAASTWEQGESFACMHPEIVEDYDLKMPGRSKVLKVEEGGPNESSQVSGLISMDNGGTLCFPQNYSLMAHLSQLSQEIGDTVNQADFSIGNVSSTESPNCGISHLRKGMGTWEGEEVPYEKHFFTATSAGSDLPPSPPFGKFTGCAREDEVNVRNVQSSVYGVPMLGEIIDISNPLEVLISKNVNCFQSSVFSKSPPGKTIDSFNSVQVLHSKNVNCIQSSIVCKPPPSKTVTSFNSGEIQHSNNVDSVQSSVFGKPFSCKTIDSFNSGEVQHSTNVNCVKSSVVSKPPAGKTMDNFNSGEVQHRNLSSNDALAAHSRMHKKNVSSVQRKNVSSEVNITKPLRNVRILPKGPLPLRYSPGEIIGTSNPGKEHSAKTSKKTFDTSLPDKIAHSLNQALQRIESAGIELPELITDEHSFNQALEDEQNKPKIFTCEICGRHLCSKGALSTHSRVHKKDVSDQTPLPPSGKFTGCSKEDEVNMRNVQSSVSIPTPGKIIDSFSPEEEQISESANHCQSSVFSKPPSGKTINSFNSGEVQHSKKVNCVQSSVVSKPLPAKATASFNSGKVQHSNNVDSVQSSVFSKPPSGKTINSFNSGEVQHSKKVNCVQSSAVSKPSSGKTIKITKPLRNVTILPKGTLPLRNVRILPKGSLPLDTPNSMGLPYQCPYCAESFRTDTAFLQHLRQQHDKTMKKTV